MKYDVVIIGGGITGLSTAYYLQKEFAAGNRELSYILLEASNSWGGKIKTHRYANEAGESFLLECGPDSFITQKPWALKLIKDLGIEDRLLPANESGSEIFLHTKRGLLPFPRGMMLMIPTEFWPFISSPLISWKGKIRMGLDLIIPRRKEQSDENLAAFINRRLGREALEKLAEPLLSGIYNAEAESQSMLATFPRFVDLEKKHGSLIRGMIEQKRRASKSTGGSASRGLFVSLKDGMQELCSCILSALTGERQLNTKVDGLTPCRTKGYKVIIGDGKEIEASTVVLTTPSYSTSTLVQELSPSAAEQLNQIPYVDTGTCSLIFQAGHLPGKKGFGVLIPRSENSRVNAISFSSNKFDGRAPAGYSLIRAFLGGSRHPGILSYDDDEIISFIREELGKILYLHIPALHYHLHRFLKSTPLYLPGHLDKVAKIEEELPAGLYLAGSPYRGISIPDCIRQARTTAAKIASELKG